jgi:phytoene/squalene synthetase
MQNIEFYQKHLDAVSRSFAFCIQKLEPPFRQWVSLSYLLCRVLDTVEDSDWPSAEVQDEHYRKFHYDLKSKRPPEKSDSIAWASMFPSDVPQGERALLRESYLLFRDLQTLPENTAKVIRDCVEQMCVGMQLYSDRAQRSTPRRALVLDDLTDLNRYCYFVAGVVGELLSHLYLIYRPNFQPDPDFHLNSLHFGLFLQKVNLLKDQSVDEAEGRLLIPDREDLFGSLKKNAVGALGYLLSLPREEKGYRTFCGWSLFLGTASLPWVQASFKNKDGSKISRSETHALLAQIESIIQDDDAIRAVFNMYLPLLDSPNLQTREHAHVPDREPWFENLTRATLARSELAELGML